MLKIKIRTVEDEEQRYNTTGDYYTDEEGNKVIVISDMGDWRYEILTALHELIESALCKHRGITDSMIDAFDFQYNSQRKKHDISEPGDDPRAPYHKEHVFADSIERLVAQELDIAWEKYSAVSDKLMEK